MWAVLLALECRCDGGGDDEQEDARVFRWQPTTAICGKYYIDALYGSLWRVVPASFARCRTRCNHHSRGDALASQQRKDVSRDTFAALSPIDGSVGWAGLTRSFPLLICLVLTDIEMGVRNKKHLGINLAKEKGKGKSLFLLAAITDTHTTGARESQSESPESPLTPDPPNLRPDYKEGTYFLLYLFS